MMKFKNQDLMDVIGFLEGVALTPKISRIRTRLCRLLRSKVDELYKDEVELLEKYGKRDTDGKLIEDEGNFSLNPDTALAYHKEKAVLLEEETVI